MTGKQLPAIILPLALLLTSCSSQAGGTVKSQDPTDTLYSTYSAAYNKTMALMASEEKYTMKIISARYSSDSSNIGTSTVTINLKEKKVNGSAKFLMDESQTNKSIGDSASQSQNIQYFSDGAQSYYTTDSSSSVGKQLVITSNDSASSMLQVVNLLDCTRDMVKSVAKDTSNPNQIDFTLDPNKFDTYSLYGGKRPKNSSGYVEAQGDAGYKQTFSNLHFQVVLNSSGYIVRQYLKCDMDMTYTNSQMQGQSSKETIDATLEYINPGKEPIIVLPDTSKAITEEQYSSMLSKANAQTSNTQNPDTD